MNVRDAVDDIVCLGFYAPVIFGTSALSFEPLCKYNHTRLQIVFCKSDTSPIIPTLSPTIPNFFYRKNFMGIRLCYYDMEKDSSIRIMFLLKMLFPKQKII